MVRQYWIRYLIIPYLLLLALPASAITVGRRAPDFVAEDQYGNTVDFGDVSREHLIILYFWDARFQICHKGLLELRELHAKYRNKVTLFAINIDHQSKTYLQKFTQDNPWARDAGRLLVNSGETARHYEAELSVPVLCIINRERRVTFYEQSFDPKKVKRALSDLLRVDAWSGFWFQYLWSDDGFDNGEIYKNGRGDVFGLGFLREGRSRATFGIQAAFSHQNPNTYKASESRLNRRVAAGSATLSWGPRPIRRSLGFSFSAGAAGYKRLGETSDLENQGDSWHIVPVVGVAAKFYIIDSISIYASAGADLDAVDKASQASQSLFQDEHLYRYETGVRLYIRNDFNLKIGYGQWRMGDRTVKGLQVDYGFTF